jgi:cell division protease FtsH
MVTHYGMSDRLGPMTYGTDEEEVFVGRDMGRGRNYSEDVASAIDQEMRRLIDVAYHKAEKLLKENMETLHRLAQALLEKETLDAREFESVFLGEEIEEVLEEETEEVEEIVEETEETLDETVEETVKEAEEESEEEIDK